MIRIKHIAAGNKERIVVIAGPCVIESLATTRKIAGFIVSACKKLNVQLIFKASYDKANRTSINARRGVGISEGLTILDRVKKEFDVPVMTDVHCRSEVSEVASVCDVIQIPAFLCRQTDLLVAAGNTGKAVNIKKGQFVAPEDMIHAVKKVTSTGNKKVLLTERGFCFGYHNLVVDMRSLDIMKKFGYPVVFDATHSVQLPGGLKLSSGGQKHFVETLARSAVAAGIAAVFFEIHPHPHKAWSDGPNALNFKQFEIIMEKIVRIDTLVKNKNF